MRIKSINLILLSLVTSSIFTMSATRGSSHQHKVDEIKETVVLNATCEKDGQKITTYTCSCGQLMKQVTSTIPALGHDFISHHGVEATCTEEGYSDYHTCSRCDYSTYHLLPAHGHHFDYENTRIMNNIAPTCTSSGGYDIYVYCDDCKQYYFNEHVYLGPEGHRLYYVEYLAPTCTSDGHSSGYTCQICGYTTVKAIPATGHNYSTYRENYIEYPSCTSEGFVQVYGYCDICHEYSSYPIAEKTIPALGHSFIHFDHVDATCTEKGHNEYIHCERCGYNTCEDIPARGHTFGSYSVSYSGAYRGYVKIIYCNDCNQLLSYEPVSNISKGISLNHDVLNMDNDSKVALTIDTELDYFVYSTNPEFATYKDGFIYSHDSGDACIYCYCQETDEIVGVHVIVGRGGAPVLEFELSEYNTYVGNTVDIINYDTNLDDVQFLTSDSSVATVSDLKVHALSAGSVYITAFSKSTGMKESLYLQVFENSIIVSQSSVVCFLNETVNLREYFTSTSPDTFTYVSSNESIATVSSGGTVKGVKNGTVTITINSKKCGSATIQVTVREKVAHNISITLSNYKSYFTETSSKDSNGNIAVRLTIKSGYVVTTRISVDIHFIEGVISSENGYFSIYPGETTSYTNSRIGGHTTYKIYEISGQVTYYT